MVKTENIDGYNEWQTLVSGRNISILSIPFFIRGKGGLRDWPTYLLQGFTEVCQCKAPNFFKITRHHLFWLQFWKTKQKECAGYVSYWLLMYHLLRENITRLSFQFPSLCFTNSGLISSIYQVSITSSAASSLTFLLLCLPLIGASAASFAKLVRSDPE